MYLWFHFIPIECFDCCEVLYYSIYYTILYSILYYSLFITDSTKKSPETSTFSPLVSVSSKKKKVHNT